MFCNYLYILQEILILSTHVYENGVHDPAYGHAQATQRTVTRLPGTVLMPTGNPRQDPHIPPIRISVKDTPIRYMRIILIKQK